MQGNDGDCCPPIKRAIGSPFLDAAAPISSVVVAGYAFWRDLPPLNEAVQRVLGGRLPTVSLTVPRSISGTFTPRPG
jgi:hypothetical protein